MSERIIEDLRTAERSQTSIYDALTRGVALDENGSSLIMPDKESLENEMQSRRLRLYLGIDPTSPELHIGHTVPLRKLRHFQNLGHDVILLFGTFTGKIGDPTDKSAARVKLTDEQIAANVADYQEQASKILDLSENAQNPVTIMYNHEWLSPLTFEDVVNLASHFTVQQMLERSMFNQRMENGQPIHLHEFLYPLMQGYDSVAMGVDIEVGGKDQIFNMLIGRDLMKEYYNRNKWVLPTKLIEDPNGRKMGKTEGNIVNIRDLPESKYEGIMSWPDSATFLGFELITSVPTHLIETARQMLENGEVDPLTLKHALAYRVVEELDGPEEAQFAQDEFRRVKKEGQLPSRIREVNVLDGSKLSQILVDSGLAKDVPEASHLLTSGSIYLDGQQARKDIIWSNRDSVITIGKKTIRNARRILAE